MLPACIFMAGHDQIMAMAVGLDVTGRYDRFELVLLSIQAF